MENSSKTPDPGGVPYRGPHRPRSAGPMEQVQVESLRLIMQSTGFTVEIQEHNTVLGRHTEADVRLPLPDISRRHCRFECAEGAWQVVDLDSLNGVFVNGQKVRQAHLRRGDVLTIGGFNFEVRVGEVTNDHPRRTEEVLRDIARALPTSTSTVAVEPRRRAS